MKNLMRGIVYFLSFLVIMMAEKSPKIIYDFNKSSDMRDWVVVDDGVMGGVSSACNKKTKSAIIEFANFMPESIIGRSIRYDLNSDAAYKFERGVDPQLIETAMRRFLKIVNDHTNIVSVRYYHQNQNQY